MNEAKKPRQAARTKLRPEQKRGEKNDLDRHWRGLFLDELADTSNVTAAAKGTGINPSRAYKVRRCEPEFARKWYVALLEGYQNLELETLHRLRYGTEADGPKFDIANSLRLLAMHRETVARERARLADTDEEVVLASLNAKLDAMRHREDQLQTRLTEDETRTPAGSHGEG